MANISRLLQLSAGIDRGIDLSTNTLVVGSITVGGSGGTTLSKAQLDALLAISSSLASTATNMGASLVGIEDYLTLYAATTVESALAEVKAEADGAVSVNTTQTTNIGNLVTLSGVAVNSTNLGAFTGATGTGLGSTDTVKQALQGVCSAIDSTNAIINKFTWCNACVDQLNTPPGSPSTGANYLVNTAPTDAWVGHANTIATWSGSVWTFYTAAIGNAVLVDTYPTAMFIFGGATWSKQTFESTTASTGLTKSTFDIQLADANANGLQVATGVFTVNVDGTTLTRLGTTGNALKVADGGIGTTQLAADGVTDAKIKLRNNNYLRARNAADDADINIVKVDGSNNIILAALPYGPSSAPGANYQLANKKYVDDAVSAGTSLINRTVTVGAALSANTSYAVRLAMPADAGYVAGRVYAADQDATSADHFHVIGLVQVGGTSLAAGDSATMIMFGTTALASGDSAFSAGAVGGPVWLATAGAFTTTAPSTANYACKIIGYVQDTTHIFVMPMQGASVN